MIAAMRWVAGGPQRWPRRWGRTRSAGRSWPRRGRLLVIADLRRSNFSTIPNWMIFCGKCWTSRRSSSSWWSSRAKNWQSSRKKWDKLFHVFVILKNIFQACIFLWGAWFCIWSAFFTSWFAFLSDKNKMSRILTYNAGCNLRNKKGRNNGRK